MEEAISSSSFSHLGERVQEVLKGTASEIVPLVEGTDQEEGSNPGRRAESSLTCRVMVGGSFPCLSVPCVSHLELLYSVCNWGREVAKLEHDHKNKQTKPRTVHLGHTPTSRDLRALVSSNISEFLL